LEEAFAMSKTAWIVVVLLGVFLLLDLASPLAVLVMSRNMYGYANRGMMGPWMLGGYGIARTVVTVLFVGLLVACVIWIVQSAERVVGRKETPGAPETPLDILKRRYASGEITKEQFEGMKRDLGL
jgi:putative membrane protein